MLQMPHSASVFLIIGFLFTMTCAALTSFPALAESGNPQAGQHIYEESCVHCHGHAGDGQGQMAEYLTPSPAKLASKTTQAKTDAELEDIILKGRTGTAMAGFEGALDETQMADLLAYLRSLKP